MTRLAAAVIELPYGCEDCKFNAYHSNGTRYCLMHYTASIRDEAAEVPAWTMGAGTAYKWD